MISWFDSSYNYVGYAAPVSGVIHYFTRDNAGVITDLGVTKPVSFVTTCCDNGTGFVDIVNLNIVGGSQVSIDTGPITPDLTLRSSPIGIMTVTNPSTSQNVEITYAVRYQRSLAVVSPRGMYVRYQGYIDPNTGTLAIETGQTGTGTLTAQITGTGFVGGSSGGNDVWDFGVVRTLLLAPGATATIRYQITTQTLYATNTTGNAQSIGKADPVIFSRRFV